MIRCFCDRCGHEVTYDYYQCSVGLPQLGQKKEKSQGVEAHLCESCLDKYKDFLAGKEVKAIEEPEK